MALSKKVCKQRGSKARGSKKSRISRVLVAESLEERVVLYATTGYRFASTDVSASFVPDGTSSEGYTASLFSLLSKTAPAATWQREFARALQTWANVSPLNFRFVSDDGSPSGIAGPLQGDSRFGDIRLAAHPLNGFLAYAYYPTGSNTLGGDIFLNTAYTFKIGANIDLYSTLLHEAGHSLGLAHSTSGTVMYSTISGVYSGLSADDISGLQAIYGARAADGYEGSGGNNSFASAKSLSVGQNGTQITADLTTISDVDFYQFTVPNSAEGTARVLADARGKSLLAPKLSVYDSVQTPISTADTAGAYGMVASAHLTGLSPGATYTVAVDGSSSDAFGMGAYKLDLKLNAGTQINFNDYAIQPYGINQDVSGTATVENSGATLHLAGNRWKRIAYPYNVTARTILEFDFKSTIEGDVHAIGFDTDLEESPTRSFKLHGTDAWGITSHDDYAGSGGAWKHYRIELGQQYTGQVYQLFFINDHDVSNPTADSYFKNVQVYESTENLPPTANDDSVVVLPTDVAVPLDVLANDNTSGDLGESLAITSVTQGSQGGTVSIIGNLVSYTPPATFNGSDTFTYTINDGTPGSYDTATVTVHFGLNLAQYPTTAYGTNQDLSGTVSVLDGGATLRLVGNRWRSIALAHNITANTVLEFDFKSTVQGELHAIGFDTDAVEESQKAFTLYGTQSWGRLDYKNYASSAGQWKHYVIPVGQFYTGSMSRLFFVNDHDVASPTGESYFRGIQVYEPGTNSPPTANDDAYGQVEPSGSVTLDVLANDSTAPDLGETLTISGVTQGSAGGTLVIQGGTTLAYTPAAGFLGRETFTYTVSDGTPGGNDTATVTVDVFLNFNTRPLSTYGVAQDLTGPVTVEDGGQTVRLVGNRWKKVTLPYTITANTILEFDFQATTTGEIFAIGFDNDLGQSPERSFKLYGWQAYGLTAYNNYAADAPAWKHYRIPVGQHYTGAMTSLFFIVDHDVLLPNANGAFRRIQVYESGAGANLVVSDELGHGSFVAPELVRGSAEPGTMGLAARLRNDEREEERAARQDSEIRPQADSPFASEGVSWWWDAMEVGPPLFRPLQLDDVIFSEIDDGKLDADLLAISDELNLALNIV